MKTRLAIMTSFTSITHIQNYRSIYNTCNVLALHCAVKIKLRNECRETG